MKEQHIKALIKDLVKDGYEKEVPVMIVKRCLLKYVGVDKYKIQSTLDLLIETGYFEQISPATMKVL